MENVNYWREIEEDIPSLLKNFHGILLLSHNSVEFTDVIDFLNRIKPDHFSDVLYISLVRSYDYAKKVLNQHQLEKKKIIFIDCVSGFAFPEDEGKDEAIYHKPPTTLSEMKEIIKFGLQKANPDIVVIDSLSQFVNFSKPTEDELNDLYDFLKTIKQTELNVDNDTFILLYDNKLSIMQNLPKKSTDLILKLEIAKNNLFWK